MRKPIMNRRQFIGTALAGAAANLASHAVAETRFLVGEKQVLALSDGHFNMPADMFLGTPESLRKRLGDPVQIAANTYAYRTDTRTFLFDAGAGKSDFITKAFSTASKLPEDLGTAGIASEDVTDIVITHMHPDHIGGLAQGDRVAFPNARIHIAAAEWNFWNAKGFETTAPDAMRPMVAAVKQMSKAFEHNIALHSGSADFGDGVSVIPAPGHTPGHTVIVLDAGRDRLVLVGDLTVHEDVHFANPNYGWALDIDSDLAVTSRKRLLDMISADGLILGAAHVSRPGLGRVERNGDGFRFLPL